MEVASWNEDDYDFEGTYCFVVGADCAGVQGGQAAVDDCGICDDDPSNDCVQDCNGDWGGLATADGCGVCDDDPANDCPATAVVFSLTADAYAGEISWALTWNGMEHSSGVPSGNGATDEFTLNLPDGSYCLNVHDAYGDGGLAGVISLEDGTELVSWADNAYLSDGSFCFTIGTDCNGVSGGSGMADMCGICDEDPSNDCTVNCNGQWGGDTSACGNVWIWLNCDANFAESRWSLVTTTQNSEGLLEYSAILAQGAPSQANWPLGPGLYHLFLWDSAGDGGCGGSVYLDGQLAATWTPAAYTYSAYLAVDIPLILP